MGIQSFREVLIRFEKNLLRTNKTRSKLVNIESRYEPRVRQTEPKKIHDEMVSAVVKSLCLSLPALRTCFSVCHSGARVANEVRVFV